MKTFTQHERTQISEVVGLLWSTGHKAAAMAVNHALHDDCNERMAKDSDRIEDEGN